MPYKDPTKQRNYQATWVRQKRQAGVRQGFDIKAIGKTHTAKMGFEPKPIPGAVDAEGDALPDY